MIIFIHLLVFLTFNKLTNVNAGGGGYGEVWSYNTEANNGPEHWAVNNSKCGGNRQSPINILTRDVKYHKLLGTLSLKQYDYVGDKVYFTVHNRNTDIAFVAKATTSGQNVPQELVLQGTTYRFYQFHFHWGGENNVGSEHMIDSQQYAGEMHMIHFNTKYKDVHTAMTHSDGLLVWGHFLKVDSTDQVGNPEFQKLLNHFPKANICCNTTKLTSFSLYHLLPKDHDKFYHYRGSLTTPPCYQSVTWIVDRNPISVSEKQMKLFRQLKDNAVLPVKNIGNNFRPVQALNGREIQSNFDTSSGNGSASMLKKSYHTFITVIAIVLTSMFVV